MTTQGFIDDATRVFNEVVALRDALQAYKESSGRSAIERQSADAAIKGLNELLAIKDRTIDQYQKLVLTLQNVIEFQFQIIEKLKAMLLKPKSFFDRFLDTVKELAKAAVFILIGRGFSVFRPDGRPWTLQDERTADLSFRAVRPQYG